MIISALTEWLAAKQYTCQCGAKYRVRAGKTFIPDTDGAVCEECGRTMDSWRNATSFRAYARIDD